MKNHRFFRAIALCAVAFLCLAQAATAQERYVIAPRPDHARFDLKLPDARSTVGLELRTAGDDIAWNLVADGGPLPRGAHAMTFDPNRNRVLMFGGVAGTSQNPVYYRDTWEWDGADWARQSTSGPDPRQNAILVYDDKRNEAVLFGGFGVLADGPAAGSFAYFRDTWVWDGSDWADTGVLGPAALFAAAAAYDPVNERVVIYGGEFPFGSNSIAFSDETWAWNGAEWSRLTSNGPFNGLYAQMAWDEQRQKLVLYGGLRLDDGSEKFVSGTWEWDDNNSQWIRTSSNQPPRRSRHAMVYDRRRECMILFGGQGDGGRLNDLWVREGTAWRQLAGDDVPGPRRFHDMVFDPLRKITTLFGGETQAGASRATWETEKLKTAAGRWMLYR